MFPGGKVGYGLRIVAGCFPVEFFSYRSTSPFAVWGRLEFDSIYSIEFKENTMTTLMVSVLAFVSGIKDRLESEKGATATEYSLLIAFIAFAIIVGVTAFGTASATWFTELGGTVAGWSNGPARLVMSNRHGVPRPPTVDAAHPPNPAATIRGGVQ